MSGDPVAQCSHGCAWPLGEDDLACPHVRGARRMAASTPSAAVTRSAGAGPAEEPSTLVTEFLKRFRDALAMQEALRLERERIARKRIGTRPAW